MLCLCSRLEFLINACVLSMRLIYKQDSCWLFQVSAKWDPAEACRPIIDEAPVFYPTTEVFTCVKK